VPARLSGEQTLAIGVSTIDLDVSRAPSEEHRETILAALRDAAEQLSNPMAARGSTA
jgi:DNA-binding IclR family transcriptional regulator